MIRPLILLAAGAALLLTACTARTAQPASADSPATGRIIRVTADRLRAGGADTVRFGRLYSGEIARMPLWIANETDEPIVLTDTRASCGCTSLEFDGQPIRAGEARQAALTFDSRGERGWQFRLIDLLVAGAERPVRIFVEVDVE